MKLIVGLGNPTQVYSNTRHNVGFMVIDKILETLKLKLNKERFSGLYVKTDEYIIAKPLTYMNNSGSFVVDLISHFKILPSDIFVIYDDMDYEVGQAVIKPKGSPNGHNGIKDIINKLKTTEIIRLKIGIGREGNSANYVLSNFSKEELPIIKEVIKLASEAAISFLFNDIRTVMNKFNIAK